jgi:hypothetical protein
MPWVKAKAVPTSRKRLKHRVFQGVGALIWAINTHQKSLNHPMTLTHASQKKCDALRQFNNNHVGHKKTRLAAGSLCAKADVFQTCIALATSAA